MIILDTATCIDYLKGKIAVKEVIDKQQELIHITTITIYEINIGLERTRRKISEKRYKELDKAWGEFMSSMEVFPLGMKEAKKAAEIYDKLEAKGQIIDDNDILIGGIMLANGIKKIITKNEKHFERIEGIEVLSY